MNTNKSGIFNLIREIEKENSVLIFKEMDNSLICIFQSSCFQSNFGYLEDTVVNKSFEDLGLWEAEFKKKELIKSIKNHPRLKELEITTKSASGEKLRTAFSMGKINIDDEELIIVYLNLIGKNENLDKESLGVKNTDTDNLYKLIANNAEDIIWVQNPVERKLTYISPSVKKVLGYSPEEIIANPENIISEENKNAFTRDIEKYIDKVIKGEAFNNESKNILEVKHKNNSIVTVEYVVSVVFDSKNKPIEILGVARNVSDRMKIEKELILAKQNAESANTLKNQFLSNMSHEIRTPMNGIIGFIDLLSITTLDEEQKELLQDARSASQVLLYVINDILDFSKIEAGKLSMEKIKFKIRSLVEECVNIASVKAQEKKLQIYVQIKSDVPEEVVGDPARLRQILNNLLSNAVKFTDEGEISIFINMVEVKKNNIVIRFEVDDTGMGIPKEYINKLFSPFTQADLTFTRRFGGTGLGLTIAKEIVKMMNGEIGVETVFGKGSKFYFTGEFEMVEMEIQKSFSFANVKNSKVLLLDDSSTDRKILRTYLEEAGCKVLETNKGELALKLIRGAAKTTEPVLAVFTDNNISDITAYDFATIVKKNAKLKKLKIIMLTSTPQRGDAIKVKQSGFCGYLSKPALREEVIQCLSLVLGLNPEDNEEGTLITRYTFAENNISIGPKILMVEDSDVNRKLILIMLKKWGFNCDVAANGQEAINSVKNKDYDIILMDCQMPLMDGFESTKAIRALEKKGKRAKIIAITIDSREGTKERCMEVGMDDYLTKPVNFEKLYDMINNLSNNKTDTI